MRNDRGNHAGLELVHVFHLGDLGHLLLAGKLWGITTGESQLGGHFVEALGWQVDGLPYFQKFGLPPILT